MSIHAQLLSARTLLVLRTDAIGDNVLGLAMLAPLRAALGPGVKIIYACQDRVAELAAACPYVDQVVPFSRGRAYADEAYRQEIAAALRACHAEVLLNPVLTREPLSDALAADAGVPVRIGFASGAAGPARGCREEAYTQLIAPRDAWLPELERVPEFLRGLGIEAATPVVPRVWLRPADETWAADFFAARACDPAKTLVLFAGAGADYRVNRHWGEALAAAFPAGDRTLLCVGAAHEFSLHEQLLASYGGLRFNLCGRTSLLQTAALLKIARLALGAETGAAHLAGAVGRPHVVVLGGGHFGRFMPWTPLTTAVCLPMSCFRCNWKCAHARAHCVVDVSAAAIARGIRAALDSRPDKPTLVIDRAAQEIPSALPTPDPFIDCSSVAVIDALPSAPLPPTRPVHRAARPPQPAVRVSAIVSTYKNEHLLRGCLQDLVEQTLFRQKQLDILVIDSASPQAEGDIVRDFQNSHGSDLIRYLRTPERETLYAAWNRGIDLARGAYLTNANTDDRHHPDMLEVLADMLDARPDCALAYCDSEVTHDLNASWKEARRVRTLKWPEFDRERLFAEPFVGPHPLWRRSVHAELGYFDATMISAGDYEFWLRLALRWPFVHVNRALGLYLENFESLSLANGGALGWYETRVARDRYWNTAWGVDPSMRGVLSCFEGLERRSRRLPRAARVALFGAGQHTSRHMVRFRQALEPHVELVAILDDRAQPGRTLGGLPVILPADWKSLGVQAIVVSSDTYESALAARAIAATAGTLPLLAVYKTTLDYFPQPAGMAGAHAR